MEIREGFIKKQGRNKKPNERPDIKIKPTNPSACCRCLKCSNA